MRFTASQFSILLLAALPLLAEASTPLFDSDELLEITLTADFSELCHPRETEDCDFTPSTLTYRGADGKKLGLDVGIQVRGGWRSLSRNCSVPLLWVHFDPAVVEGTLFEGQSLLPLTTHCGRGISADPAFSGIRRSDYEQYVLREYLGHRLYNELTAYSLRARLLRIAYPKPGSNRGVHHYAFFVEHFDDAAERTGTRRQERGQFDPEKLDADAAARLALFQYMIGNTDWSIARERNTMLLLTDDGRQLPVPYDLDMSGLVNAGYAGPAPGVPIDTVRQRWFLGYCQPGTDWAALFSLFQERRDSILAAGEELPGFSRNSLRSTRTFLDQFFKVLDSPEARQERIVGACLPWPPSGEDHMAPPSGIRGRR
jgi:hypothetical protein